MGLFQNQISVIAVFLQQSCRANDDVQRGTYFMADSCNEVGLGLIASLSSLPCIGQIHLKSFLGRDISADHVDGGLFEVVDEGQRSIYPDLVVIVGGVNPEFQLAMPS